MFNQSMATCLPESPLRPSWWHRTLQLVAEVYFCFWKAIFRWHCVIQPWSDHAPLYSYLRRSNSVTSTLRMTCRTAKTRNSIAALQSVLWQLVYFCSFGSYRRVAYTSTRNLEVPLVYRRRWMCEGRLPGWGLRSVEEGHRSGAILASIEVGVYPGSHQFALKWHLVEKPGCKQYIEVSLYWAEPQTLPVVIARCVNMAGKPLSRPRELQRIFAIKGWDIVFTRVRIIMGRLRIVYCAHHLLFSTERLISPVLWIVLACKE